MGTGGFILPDPILRTKTQFLVVCSKDRNRTLYPNISDYRIGFFDLVGETYRNIQKISLFGGIIPDKNNVTQEPYLLLTIDELTGKTFDATNTPMKNAFAMMQLDRPIANDHFFNIRSEFCRSTFLDGTTLDGTTLSSMRIRIMKQDGTLFDFGNDDGQDPDLSLNHTLIFEVETIG